MYLSIWFVFINICHSLSIRYYMKNFIWSFIIKCQNQYFDLKVNTYYIHYTSFVVFSLYFYMPAYVNSFLLISAFIYTCRALYFNLYFCLCYYWGTGHFLSSVETFLQKDDSLSLSPSLTCNHFWNAGGWT